MAKNKLVFEKDEKKSIIIGLIVSIIVIIAVVLAFVAIRRYKGGHNEVITTTGTVGESTETAEGNVTTVENQDELNLALADMATTSILFKSENEQAIVIPGGDYSEMALIIDAPYTEVTNYGTFSTITINQIAANTWTESVSGNSIVLDADSSHLIIPSGISVTSVENIRSGSTLAIENQGSIGLLSLEADDSIASVRVDGELQETILYSMTNLTLSGSRTMSTALEVEYGADGSSVNTSIPLDISTFAGMNVEYNSGAEGSSLTIGSSENTVSVVNNTSSDIAVTKADGSSEVVAAGQSASYEGTNAPTEGSTVLSGDTTAGESSSSSSGGSSSGSPVSAGSSVSSGSSGSRGGSSGSSSGSSGSSSGSSGSTSTSTTTGYTEEQVQNMISSAVSNATKDLLTQDEVNKKINEAIEAAKSEQTNNEDLYNKEQVQDLINEAVKDAISDAVSDYVKQNVIVSCRNLIPIYAGDAGSGSLKTINELGLPNRIEGMTDEGYPIFIPVKRWANMNGYSENAGCGTYHFVAELPDGYVLSSAVKPEFKVFVGDPNLKSSVVFADAGSNCVEVVQILAEPDTVTSYLNGIEMTNLSDAYYVVHNNSGGRKMITLRYYYYDFENEMMALTNSSWSSGYIKTDSFAVTDREALIGIDYKKCIVEVSVDRCDDEQAETPRLVSTGIINVGATNQVEMLAQEEAALTEYAANGLMVDVRRSENSVEYVPLSYWKIDTSIIDGGINLNRRILHNLNSKQTVQGNKEYFIYETGGYAKE